MNIIKLIEKEPSFYLFKKAWKFSGGVKKRLLSSFILNIAETSLFATIPLFVGKLINQIQLEGVTQTNIENIFGIIFILVLICVLVAILTFVSDMQKGEAQFCVFANYKSHLIKKIFQLDLHWRADKNSGDIIDKTNNASNGLKRSINIVGYMVSNLTSLIVSISVLIYFSVFVGMSAFFVFGFLFIGLDIFS